MSIPFEYASVATLNSEARKSSFPLSFARFDSASVADRGLAPVFSRPPLGPTSEGPSATEAAVVMLQREVVVPNNPGRLRRFPLFFFLPAESGFEGRSPMRYERPGGGWERERENERGARSDYYHSLCTMLLSFSMLVTNS